MPLDVQIIRAREFVRMGPRGELDLEATRAVLETLAAACRKRGIERALLDGRDARTNLTAAEMAELVQIFRLVGFPNGQKLALLHSGDPRRRARILTFIGALRGWSVRAFEDFEKAVEWLALSEGTEGPTKERGEEVPIRMIKPAGNGPGRVESFHQKG